MPLAVASQGYRDALRIAEQRTGPEGYSAGFRAQHRAWRHRLLLAASFGTAPRVSLVGYGTALWLEKGANVGGGFACLVYNSMRDLVVFAFYVAASVAAVCARAVGLGAEPAGQQTAAAEPENAAAGGPQQPDGGSLVHRSWQTLAFAANFVVTRTGALSMCFAGAFGAACGAAVGCVYYCALVICLGERHPIARSLAVGLGAAVESERFAGCLQQAQRAAAIGLLAPVAVPQAAHDGGDDHVPEGGGTNGADGAAATNDAAPSAGGAQSSGTLAAGSSALAGTSTAAADTAAPAIGATLTAEERCTMQRAETLARHLAAGIADEATNFRRDCVLLYGLDPSVPYAADTPTERIYADPAPLGPFAAAVWRQAYAHGLSDLPLAADGEPAASYAARGHLFLTALRDHPTWAYLLDLPTAPTGQAAMTRHQRELLASARFEGACADFLQVLTDARRRTAAGPTTAQDGLRRDMAIKVALAECVAGARLAINLPPAR